jgi:glycosyltransferase involved in cell wall biosynthesis
MGARAAITSVPTAGRTAPGISVVMATYRGARWIGTALASLGDQDLAHEAFEVVVVMNGPHDGTASVVESFARTNPSVMVRRVRTGVTGFATARTLGLHAAARDYVTFIDDDDRVSPGYLKALLDHAGPDRIAVARLADRASATQFVDFDTYANRETLPSAGAVVPPDDCPAAARFDVAKVVPTWMARSVGYDPALASGNDVVFWHQVINTYRLLVSVLPPNADATYYRTLRDQSHSRPSDLTYDFSIRQRLDVIERLDSIASDGSQWAFGSARRAVRSQIWHMRRFLSSHPERIPEVLADLESRSLRWFPIETLSAGFDPTLFRAGSAQRPRAR